MGRGGRDESDWESGGDKTQPVIFWVLRMLKLVVMIFETLLPRWVLN